MLTEIRKINQGDMPDFDAALEVAYQGLITSKAYLKHCIILSDGDPSPPAQGLVDKFNAAQNHRFDDCHWPARSVGRDAEHV